jgi:hypothetical protein
VDVDIRIPGDHVHQRFGVQGFIPGGFPESGGGVAVEVAEDGMDGAAAFPRSIVRYELSSVTE